MADQVADDVADLGQHWGWVLFFGGVTTVAGVATPVRPGRTVVVLAVLFGAQLIVEGVFRLVAALAAEQESGAVADPGRAPGQLVGDLRGD